MLLRWGLSGSHILKVLQKTVTSNQKLPIGILNAMMVEFEKSADSLHFLSKIIWLLKYKK